MADAMYKPAYPQVLQPLRENPAIEGYQLAPYGSPQTQFYFVMADPDHEDVQAAFKEANANYKAASDAGIKIIPPVGIWIDGEFYNSDDEYNF